MSGKNPSNHLSIRFHHSHIHILHLRSRIDDMCTYHNNAVHSFSIPLTKFCIAIIHKHFFSTIWAFKRTPSSNARARACFFTFIRHACKAMHARFCKFLLHQIFAEQFKSRHLYSSPLILLTIFSASSLDQHSFGVSRIAD